MSPALLKNLCSLPFSGDPAFLCAPVSFCLCIEASFTSFLLPPQPWSPSLSSKVNHSSLCVSEALHPCLQHSTTLYDRYRFLCLFPFLTAAAQRWELGPAHLCPQDLLQCSGHSSGEDVCSRNLFPSPVVCERVSPDDTQMASFTAQGVWSDRRYPGWTRNEQFP